MSPPTRLLIVDDSALYRQTMNNALRDEPHVTVVGVAANGVDALEKIETLDPDLLTLDVQMPDLDGVGLLREMRRRRLRPKAIMVSSLTAQGAQVTTDALLEGAFDFILKPSGPDSDDNRRQLRQALHDKITAFRESNGGRRVLQRRSGVDRPAIRAAARPPASGCAAVVIGTSTGGPAALKAVLPRLPGDLAVPVVVVQHMPGQYTHSLARRLDELSAVRVVEAADGDEAAPGVALIAPGGRQMRVAAAGNRLVVQVTDDPPENGCRPSVDYLLRSAVDALADRVLAVIMTGMGRDGLAACAQLKRKGGRVFAQHEYGCTVYGMPKAVIDEGLADRVLPLGRIAPAIARHAAVDREVES